MYIAEVGRLPVFRTYIRYEACLSLNQKKLWSMHVKISALGSGRENELKIRGGNAGKNNGEIKLLRQHNKKITEPLSVNVDLDGW